MIPKLVPKRQLMSANGIFTLTLNAAFAVGFTLLGPLIVKIAGAAGADRRRRRAVLRGRRPSAGPCRPLRRRRARRDRSRRRGRVREAESAMGEVVDPASRGDRLHPRPPPGALVAGLPRDRRLPRRRARRHRPGVRREDPRPQPGGLRRHRPAARRRDRGRDPPAQRLWPADPSPAGHRGRPDRARRAPRADGAVRPDQCGPRPPDLEHEPAGPVAPDVAPVDRRRRRVLRRHRLRLRRDPVADPAPGGPPGGRPRSCVRRPEHARLGRELPADPHRRPDRGPRRHDGSHGHRGRLHRDRRGRSRSTCAGRCGRSSAIRGRPWARTATRSSRRSAPRSRATIRSSPTSTGARRPRRSRPGSGPTAGPDRRREVVEAAEAVPKIARRTPTHRRGIGRSDARADPDLDPDRDDDRDPHPAG